ncbi:MAG: hypothetical protein K0Q87_4932, partial [Neobacillus sp.]|nr:hypothetical protein [Neobacillus sp.]
MSVKDYKQGIIDDARAHESHERKMEKAITCVAQDNKKWRDIYGNVVDSIIDQLSEQERKELYGVNTVVDIGEL